MEVGGLHLGWADNDPGGAGLPILLGGMVVERQAIKGFFHSLLGYTALTESKNLHQGR